MRSGWEQLKGSVSGQVYKLVTRSCGGYHPPRFLTKLLGGMSEVAGPQRPEPFAHDRDRRPVVLDSALHEYERRPLHHLFVWRNERLWDNYVRISVFVLQQQKDGSSRGGRSLSNGHESPDSHDLTISHLFELLA